MIIYVCVCVYYIYIYIYKGVCVCFVYGVCGCVLWCLTVKVKDNRVKGGCGLVDQPV